MKSYDISNYALGAATRLTAFAMRKTHGAVHSNQYNCWDACLFLPTMHNMLSSSFLPYNSLKNVLRI